MRICIIANGYPSDKDPQFGCFEKDQAIALQKQGHEVIILYVDGRFREHWRKLGLISIEEKGIKVFGIFLFPMSLLLRLNYKLHFKIRCRMLDWVFKHMLKYSQKPDVIYAHFLYNISYATYLKKKYSIPLVGIEHWSELNKPTLPKSISYRGKIAYDNADKIISVSESLKKQIYKHFNRDSIVVHNMVGEEFFFQQALQNKNRDEIIFISTGSLITRKGYDVLIKALAKINNKLKKWELKIIGDGPEKENLQRMIDENELTKHIKLVGRKNKQEIISLLHNSDIFLFPSRMENFSVAVLEALSAGLPVVATICGGIKECIDKKNGILLPVEDVDGLANGILNMYINIENYSRQAISDDCKKRFAPKVIAQQLTSIFEEVVTKHQSQK